MCPFASDWVTEAEMFCEVALSAKKRSRSKTEDTRGRGYSSPGGKRAKFVYQTPTKDLD